MTLSWYRIPKNATNHRSHSFESDVITSVFNNLASLKIITEAQIFHDRSSLDSPGFHLKLAAQHEQPLPPLSLSLSPRQVVSTRDSLHRYIPHCCSVLKSSRSLNHWICQSSNNCKFRFKIKNTHFTTTTSKRGKSFIVKFQFGFLNFSSKPDASVHQESQSHQHFKKPFLNCVHKFDCVRFL